MKKNILFAAVCSSALLLAACGDETTDAATETGSEDAAEATTGCTDDEMLAKANALSEKMQGMAGDMEAMQAMGEKMQEIQEKVQAGAADGTFTAAEACEAYDELLEAAE